MSESGFKRYKRYAAYFMEWFFMEKIRGLDFTMRDLTLLKKSGGKFHGYSKTDGSHAKEILDALQAFGSIEEMKLLDIGCGKGSFLREASRYPFKNIAGIEYAEGLVKTANKNFRILRLDSRVRVYHVDALKFDFYRAFNVFYFFNPFEKEIMDTVMERIVSLVKHKYWIILHNPVCAESVKNYGGIEKKRLYDHVKSYETVIYEMNA